MAAAHRVQVASGRGLAWGKPEAFSRLRKQVFPLRGVRAWPHILHGSRLLREEGRQEADTTPERPFPGQGMTSGRSVFHH